MWISCNFHAPSSDKIIFRYNSTAGITSLDPAYSRTIENIRAVNQLFNGLVQLDDSLNIVPCIAKKWSVSDDGLVYTFYLRNDVFFHNHKSITEANKKVKASDFEFSFGRIIDAKTASDGAWIFNGTVAEKNPFLAIDDTTFQIQLSKPYAPFLSILTMSYCHVVPYEVVADLGDEFGKSPIGTGPFQFANWADGIKLNFIKNDNYFESTEENPLPKVDAVSISFIQSKQSELLELFQGKLDVFRDLESSFKDEILDAEGNLNAKHADNIRLYKSPFLNTEYLAFNTEYSESEVNNKIFRQALSYAVNREAMIKYLRNNVGFPADGGFTPRGLPAYVNFPEKAFDRTKALQLLQESGVSKDVNLKLTTTKEYLDLCILVQKDLEAIGVKCRLEVIPSSLLKQQKSAGDLAFFRSSWIADYPDGENYMACFYSQNLAPNGPNYTRYASEKFDLLYQELLNTTDLARRRELFEAMEAELHESMPFILLYYDESLWLHSKNVSNFFVNGLNQLDIKRVVLTSGSQ